MKKAFLVSALFIVFLAWTGLALSKEWKGVDDTVVNKISRERGRPASETLLERAGGGDLELFAFMIAGVAGGFAAGYFYRALTGKNKKEGG